MNIPLKASEVNEFDTTIFLSAKLSPDVELMIVYDDKDSSSDKVALKIELLKNGVSIKTGICNTTVSRSLYEELKKELLS